jgi:hypothetical protein
VDIRRQLAGHVKHTETDGAAFKRHREYLLPVRS